MSFQIGPKPPPTLDDRAPRLIAAIPPGGVSRACIAVVTGGQKRGVTMWFLNVSRCMILLFLIVMLTACGGGGGGDEPEPTSGAAVEPTVTVARSPAPTETAAPAATATPRPTATRAPTATPRPTATATTAPTATATATATAPPSPPVVEAIDVDGVITGRWYVQQRPASGKLTLWGELANQVDQPLAILATVKVFDAAGAELANQPVMLIRPVIDVGGMTPFIDDIAIDDFASIASQTITVEYGVLAPDTPIGELYDGMYSFNLSLTQIAWTADGIAGEVRNDDATSVRTVLVLIAAYDAGGELIGVQPTIANTANDEPLQPATSITFTAEPDLVTAVPATVAAVVWGIGE